MTAGAVVGLMAGVGLALIVAGAPPMRRPTLADRLSPYLKDAPTASRLLDRPPTAPGWFSRLVGPFVRDGVRLLDRTLGGLASTRRRLDQAGLDMSLEQFRIEQMVWGVTGLLAGLVFAALALLGGHADPVLLLLLSGLLAVAGVVGRDRWLSVQVSRREQRILAEFPVVADLLALAVSAGESPVAAITRVTRLSRGDLSRELARCVADMHAGLSFVAALEGLAGRTSVGVLARFADAVAVAAERGTPLAEVLRGQALDVRDAGRRSLMEAGGKKEIAMLIPVVFLILPVTVIFALFPGLASITLTT